MGEIRHEGVIVEDGDKQPTEAEMAAAREAVIQKVAEVRSSNRAGEQVITWETPVQLLAFKQMLHPEYTYQQALAEWESNVAIRTSGPLEIEKLATEVPA